MKNIILIMSDTFRYDNLFDRAAAMPVRTPELDRFAGERATSIERFTMGSFPTIPQRTDLATGRLGWPFYPWQPIERSSRNSIASLLQQQSYTTQLICDCPHLFRAHFNEHFEAAYHLRGQEGDNFLTHLNDPIQPGVAKSKVRVDPWLYKEKYTLSELHRWINRYCRYEAESFSHRTASTATRWLEENSEANPFFLWIDFFDPHEPWDPPEYLVRRYDPDYAGQPMIHPNYGPSSAYTAAELKNLRAHYAAESELVDRAIGRVLQKIDDLQIWEESIVLFTSDHGTSIGEHGRCGKSNIHPEDMRNWPIYPEIGHVPFLLAGGDIPQGASLDLMAQPIDIMPTLLELAGLELEAPEPVQGRSFAAQVLNGDERFRDLAVSGGYVDPDENSFWGSMKIMPFVVNRQWGYAPVGSAGQTELYDLAVDPLAACDCAATHPEAIQEMHTAFLAHLREHGATEDSCSKWPTPAPQQTTTKGTP